MNNLKHYLRKLLLNKTSNRKDIIAYKNNAWNNEAAANHYKTAVELVLFECLTLPIYKRYMKSKHNVLEVGCGTGRLTKPLVESVSKVTALDFSKSMIDLIDDHDNLIKEVGDCHQLIFPDNSFDAVFSLDFLSHFPTWKTLLKEQIRVLSPRGFLVCNYLPKENSLNIDEKYNCNDKLPVSVSEIGSLISESDLKYFCESNGCELVKIVPYGFFWGNDLYTGFMSKNNATKVSNDFLHSFTNNLLYRQRIIQMENVLSDIDNPMISSRAVMIIKKNV
jgi:SAM-dependent methyltransferase